MADNQRGALRGKITDALISHTLTEANGGRPSRIGLDLLPPADRARVEGNARSRADAVMPVIADELDARWEHGRKHGLRQARAPQRGRERQLEAEIDRANLRADRRAADLRVKNRRVRELEADNQRLRALADRRWLAWKSARLRATNNRTAVQVLWEQIAHQDARETSLEDSQARILAIVAEWVYSASEYGGVDHGDLCDDLRAAGYTLPTTDEENDR